MIWGESDKLIPSAYAADFQRAISGSQVTMIPQAGHAVPFEKPDEVAAAIAQLTT